MAPILRNRAWMSTATVGTGTITLGSALSGYQSFADAGVSNAAVVRYTIIDSAAWEIGTGTYTSAGTTLTRTVSESSNADAAISLSGSASVFITASYEDIIGGSTGSTDNAAVRADGTDTRTLQASALLIADSTGALSRSGGGGIPIEATNTNQTTAAGNVGEYLSAQLAVASATALTTNVAKTVISKDFTAGNWMIWAQIGFAPSAAPTRFVAGISTTTNTQPSVDQYGGISMLSYTSGSALSNIVPVAPIIVSLSATTTYYAVATAIFGSGTVDAWGSIMGIRLP